MNRGFGASLGRWVLILLLAAPVLALAWSLYGQHGMFFWDAKTIPCGIQAAVQTGNPNAYLDPTYPGPCAGDSFQYMLPPAATSLLAGFAGLIGLPLLGAAYLALYALALGLLGRSALRQGASPRELLLFAGLLACGVFVYDVGGGNITIAFAGLLAGLMATAGQNRHWAAGTVLLCAAASALKPLYALYLLIPLFAAGAWLPVAAAAAAVTVAYALDAALQAPQFDQWLNLIIPVVYGQPHFGLMRLMEWLGFGAGHWLVLGGGYVLWCAAIVALLWSVRGRLPTAEDRAWAALLAVTLMLPRLKEYDAIVLIPLAFWLRSQLPAPRQALFQRLAVALAFLAPALWWWVRKIGLLIAVPDPTLTQIADPRWHISTPGFFLAGLLVLMFGFLVWPAAPRPAPAPSYSG